jgi:hypothetical protein
MAWRWGWKFEHTRVQMISDSRRFRNKKIQKSQRSSIESKRKNLHRKLSPSKVFKEVAMESQPQDLFTVHREPWQHSQMLH